jgi:hypothetical protein
MSAELGSVAACRLWKMELHLVLQQLAIIQCNGNTWITDWLCHCGCVHGSLITVKEVAFYMAAWQSAQCVQLPAILSCSW